MPRRIGKEEKNQKEGVEQVEVEQTSQSQEENNLEFSNKQANSSEINHNQELDLSPEMIDAIEKDNAVELSDNSKEQVKVDIKEEKEEREEQEDKGPNFIESDDSVSIGERLADRASKTSETLHAPDQFDDLGAFEPAIQVTTNKAGFNVKDTIEKFETIAGKKPKQEFILEPEDGRKRGARAAEKIDISQIDESVIMRLPQIKAASFEIIDILNPKPKDPAIRFRWVNYKNNVAGNMSRYLALGFTVATLADVDLEKTPIDPSMIDGTQIKYYDVVLLSINVLRLMALYKANILKSANRLIKAKERGLNEANRQFAENLKSDGRMVAGYNRAKQALNGRDPVAFYDPDNEVTAVV
jgi:hypothetical protein